MNNIPSPTLVMLAGLPGTGKTTLAYALGRALGWPVLRKDLFNTVLLESGVEQQQAAPLAYEQILTLAQDLFVHQRLSVILDTAGRQPFILERAVAIAQRGDGRLRVIRCVAPHAVRAERMARRVAGPSQWVNDDTTDEQEARWYAHLPPATLLLHTEEPPETLVKRATAFVCQP